MFCHNFDPDNSPDATSGNPGQRWKSSSAAFTCLHPAALVQRVPVRLRVSRTPNANVKAGAQTRVHVIYHRGSGLPHDQAEKTVAGGGDVRVEARVSSKTVRLHKKHQSPHVHVCVWMYVCFRSDCTDCRPERLPPFILTFCLCCISSHQQHWAKEISKKNKNKSVTSCIIAQQLHHFYSRTSCHVNSCCWILS